jgi:molybdopterin-guanine dinucleotide biosynthesis protein A
VIRDEAMRTPLTSSVTSRVTGGAVLTGGASTRFGSPKALAEVEGVPMALRVATALAGGGCHRVVAVGSIDGLAEIWERGAALVPGCSGVVVPDRWPGEGPLAGVITALSTCGHDVVTAACDLPWLDAAAVESVLAMVQRREDVQAVHGSLSGRLVPVIWWSFSSLPILEAAFDHGLRSLHGALDLVNVAMVEFSAAAAHGANSPSDL